MNRKDMYCLNDGDEPPEASDERIDDLESKVKTLVERIVELESWVDFLKDAYLENDK